MKIYNKLVRDRIPEIIEQSGKKCSIHRVEGYDFLVALDNKFIEEFEEFKKVRTIDELADLIEVFYEYLEYFYLDDQAIERQRKLKYNKNGGFKKKIILEHVDE